jgi:hypothetical protein
MTKVPMSHIFEGKKFLWDGEEYEGEENANVVEADYREKGFEVRRIIAGSKVVLYTRRVVSSTETPEQ